jgi:protein involved in polysaccharide export with SLBB domain
MKGRLLIIAFLVVLSGCVGSKRADRTAPQFSGAPSAVVSNKATNESPSTNSSGKAESEGVVRVGNFLLITFTNLPSGSVIPAFEQQVRDDGTVRLIYNQMFQAAGKKTGDLEEEIRDYYVPKYFSELTVAVRVSCETACVYVDGEVRNPGRYPWTNGMRLKDAIEVAGGFTEFANHRIKMIHEDGAIETYKLWGDWVATNNPVLKPGDRIHNPRRILYQ